MIVVDASVAVKWLVPEARRDSALALLSGKEKLIAPALVRIEVAAALIRKWRLKELDGEDAEAACNLWFAALSDGVLTLAPDEENLVAAVRLAIKVEHPLQDCLYLALAQRTGASLVTADRSFSQKARRVYDEVKLLA